MARAAAGPEIERLIQLLARLPGLGPRSARRAALHLVKKKEQLLIPLATALAETRDTILTCETCGNIDTQSPCTLCRDNTRDRSLICVVEEVGDLWALERAAVINGLYHVLGGTLSPLDGVGPDDLGIAKLIERASDPQVTRSAACAQRHGRRPVNRALPDGSACRLQRHRVAACAWRAHRR